MERVSDSSFLQSVQERVREITEHAKSHPEIDATIEQRLTTERAKQDAVAHEAAMRRLQFTSPSITRQVRRRRDIDD